MNTQTVYGQIKSGLLALLLVVAWSLKTGHTLLMHHAHRDAPVCEAARTGHSTHLHDDRYNPEDCSLCAFVFAIPELVSVSVPLQYPEIRIRRSLAAAVTPSLPSEPASVQLRGPPVQ